MFSFHLTTTCHVEAIFNVAGHEVHIGHSSTNGDKLQELLNNIFLLHDLMLDGDKAFFPYQGSTVWNDDMNSYEWRLSADSPDAKLSLTIAELFNDLAAPHILLEVSVSMREVLQDVFASLETAYQSFGLIGYKKVWEVGNFPVCEYLSLKAMFVNVELKDFTDDTVPEWHNKISQLQEVRLLA